MTDYTDLKARLRDCVPLREPGGARRALQDALAAIEELEAAQPQRGEPACNCRQEHRKRAGQWFCPLHGSVDGTHMGDDGEVAESVPLYTAPQPAQADEARELLREVMNELIVDPEASWPDIQRGEKLQERIDAYLVRTGGKEE